MGLWSRLFRRRGADVTTAGSAVENPAPQDRAKDDPVELPVEPYVFECQSCGKVFEARRRRVACPECDSRAVSLMSE